MKRQVPVLDVLFLNVRANMLRLLFCTPPTEHYVRELMNLTGLALCTVQDELRKLNTVGLVTSWSNGYRRYYRANQAHALFADLCRVVQTCGRPSSRKTRGVAPKTVPEEEAQALATTGDYAVGRSAAELGAVLTAKAR